MELRSQAEGEVDLVGVTTGDEVFDGGDRRLVVGLIGVWLPWGEGVGLVWGDLEVGEGG